VASGRQIKKYQKPAKYSRRPLRRSTSRTTLSITCLNHATRKPLSYKNGNEIIMSIRIEGWPEGHPHLTKIDGYPFGFPQGACPDPLSYTKRDGYGSSFRRLYNSYKSRAMKQGVEFTLNERHFFEVTSQPCYVCATPPSRKVNKKAKNSYIYNGIDRMDSAKGYVINNCFACCWEHNDLKGKLTYKEFFRHSLAVVLSECSKTAVDNGDLECLDRLIELFPNVRFLKKHRSALLKDIERYPNRLRFNWLLRPVQTQLSPKK